MKRLQDKYSVRIIFPQSNSEKDALFESQKPDEIIIIGEDKGVQNAKKELVELANYEVRLSNN